MKARFLLALLCLLSFGGACAKKQEITPPPPPLRPDPEPQPKAPQTVVQKDCEPATADNQPKAWTYQERSISEGLRETEEAKNTLQLGAGAEVEPKLRESYTTDAVKHLINALGADPYNVTATYMLAGTYARIGRKQCALNLLERVVAMRAHPSKKAEVDLNLDKLLGRKQPLDANFTDMRRDPAFRALVQKICENSNDPNCVRTQ